MAENGDGAPHAGTTVPFMRRSPKWWTWDLELGLHLLDRMADRHFSEIDLRTMLSDATAYPVTP